MIGSEIDNEIVLAQKIRGLVTQHETDIQRLKKRVPQWIVHPIMVTGIELPAESSSFSSSESSSFSSSDSSSESSSVSSSVSSSESSSVSSSESASSSESSSVSSSESSSVSSSASSSESSSTSSSASSSDTSSSSVEGTPCQSCDNIPTLLQVTVSNSSSSAIGPVPGTYDMLYDTGQNAWYTLCLNSTGGGVYSSSIWPHCHLRLACYPSSEWINHGTGGSFPYSPATSFLVLEIEFCYESDCSGSTVPTSSWQVLARFDGGSTCVPFYMIGSWTSGYGSGSNIVTAEVTA